MSSKGSESFGGGNPWNYIQPWDDELFGAEVRDPAKRAMWEQAVAVAGGLPYIWTELAARFPRSFTAYSNCGQETGCCSSAKGSRLPDGSRT